MDLVNVLDNKFLSKLFPLGINSKVTLGQVDLDFSDRVGLHLHLREKPIVEVGKWGVWGSDYDVVVIEVLGQLIKNVKIENWQNSGDCDFQIDQEDEAYRLDFSGDDFNFNFVIGSLTFQGASVYKL